MKICGKCKNKKSLSEFAWKNKSKNLYQYQCRDCQKRYRTDHYLSNKKEILKRVQGRKKELMALYWNYKCNSVCVDCGESDPVVLEFDHLYDKKFSISSMVQNGMSWENILLEIEECEVVCCNDHRRRTHDRAGWVRT